MAKHTFGNSKATELMTLL